MRHQPLTDSGPSHTVGLLCYLLKAHQEPDESCIPFDHATFSQQPCWSYLGLGIHFLSIVLRNPVGAFQLLPYKPILDMECVLA